MVHTWCCGAHGAVRHMVLWGTLRVDFRSEKYPMTVNRSLDVSDGSGFNGFKSRFFPAADGAVYDPGAAKSQPINYPTRFSAAYRNLTCRLCPLEH